ncbi:MAG: porin family protein [Spirochaetes bacterium]|nr:porin family protein [Spirochaetota bacterium]
MVKYFLYFLVSLNIVFLCSQSDARSIDQGTIAIGGNLNAFSETRNLKKGDDSDKYYFYINGSYFTIRNVEIGTGMYYDSFKSDSQKITSWSLSPFIAYHLSLNENSDVYGRAGVFLTSQNNSQDINNASTQKWSADSTGIQIEAGWEYFFTPNVAVDISISYSRVQWDLIGYPFSSDTENRFYWPMIGLRVFF